MITINKFLVFLIFSQVVYAFPKPEDDMSIFYKHADRNARIVGGTPAARGSHPHMVAMTKNFLIRSLVCGGSLVTPRTVLTAAHCIASVFSSGALSSSLRVVVGTNQWNSGGQIYAVARNITHPNYVSQTLKNDLGLLITTSDVEYNDLVRPIALNFIPSGFPVRVAGWGRIGRNQPLSPDLLEINARIIDGDGCVRAVRQAIIDLGIQAPPVEPHIEICTFHAAGTGTCNGDSGSALVRIDNDEEIGIVSWGFPCAKGAPDMFVRISAYRAWLEENII
ncbi:LOW QUALITY PROTEIN: chymotrypsin-2 [Bombyx mori]|uniref:LOW QUALITY PROTEIN: chymotrypsin-2 n=1 Tax=Bombyx mori TaxID=7091 RepID=UPI002ED66484